jgi:hypothetical protein
VIPKSMRYQLAGIQHIEYFEGNEDAAFRSMCVALSRLGVSNVSEGGNAEGEAVPVRPHRTEPPTKPSAGVGKGKWVTARLGRGRTCVDVGASTGEDARSKPWPSAGQAAKRCWQRGRSAEE